jgi:hypothetical protein
MSDDAGTSDIQAGVTLLRKRTAGTPGAAHTELYVASVPASRAPSDYTARIVPNLPGGLPLEAAHILRQR